jgi:hypothetical protein
MIKIEVTGNSIPEVADKLLAIGHSLYSQTVVPIANGGTSAQTLEEVMEVAEAAPVDPTPVAEPAATPASSSKQAEASTDTSAPAALASEDEELEVVDLPIAPPADEIDLRALVLKVVETRGKPFMEGILTSFGVVKASHVEPARLHELVARCQEALGK